MSNSTQPLPYTICTPWQLPDACSRTVNRYCLYSSISESDDTQDIMKSKDFNYGQPSRHVALKSMKTITIGHGDLFKVLEPFEIRCIYPYFTAGITIISFYKLSDAQKCMDIIQSQFNHMYTTCYVKPCLIYKNLNENIFITIRHNNSKKEVPPRAAETKCNYLNKLLSLDSIHSLSEANISDDLKVVGVEFDDERTSAKLLLNSHDIVFDKEYSMEAFEAKNNSFLCSCHANKDLRWKQQDTLPTCFLNSKFIEMDINNNNNCISSDNRNSNANKIYYSKNHENHSFFSVDPFSLKAENTTSKSTTTTAVELSCTNSNSADIEVVSSFSSSSSSSSSCTTTSDHSDDWQRSKRESYDSSMLTCTTRSSPTLSTSTKHVEDDEHDVVSSDHEYVTPTMSMSPITTTTMTSSISSSSLTDSSSTTKTVIVSEKPVSYGKKKSKDERKNDFNIENILNGTDLRTTFMIRNIPNKYTQQMLIDCINETHAGTYDFLYLRIDFKNKCNVGYAFINFINVESVISFYKNRDGKKWKLFNSDKKCALSYANIQGKDALIRKFKNSQVMDEDPAYKPKLFYTEGVNKGKEQPFPKPDDSNQTSKNNSQPSKHHHRSRNQRKR